VPEFVETRRNIGLEHPMVVPGAQSVYLGDRILSATSGAEAVTNRREIRLEYRFQHQQQRSLDQPVSRRRDPEPTQLRTTRFGDEPFPHRQRSERAGPEPDPNLLQKLPDVGVASDNRW